jgi:hypothetical protein
MVNTKNNYTGVCSQKREFPWTAEYVAEPMSSAYADKTMAGSLGIETLRVSRS